MTPLRIIQMQIVDTIKHVEHGELTIDRVVPVIMGLGLDGRVYRYDENEKHWTPVTTLRVNPLHKQPKKQRVVIEDEKGEGV